MGSAGAATVGVSELAAGDSPGEPQAPSARRLIASREKVAGRATEGGGWGDIRKRGYPVRGAGRGCGTRVGRAQCCRCWFRAPARCRSETGAPGGCGTRVGWAQCCRCWFRAPARCRSETGAPRGCGTRVGWARCCRCWFRAPARCRSETGAPREVRHSRRLGAVLSVLVSRSRAMPVGDRRSWRVRHSRWQGAVLSALVSRSRAMPVGDRRSWRVRHSRWLGAVLSVLVSRSRAMPVGDRRSNWPALQVPRGNLPCP